MEPNLNPQPPKWADGFLSWFCSEEVVETLQGDLHELYQKRFNQSGKIKADFYFIGDVISACRPFAFRRRRKTKPSLFNQFTMIRHYLKISGRNLLRNKGYAFINIGGLAAGIAVTLLISLWIYDELTFNHIHTNHQYIGKVMRDGTLNGETYTTSYQPYALADELRTVYGNNFEHVVMSWSVSDRILSYDDKKFLQKGTFIENGAPEMFSFHMIYGTSDGLKDPHSIMLSASAAKTLFGDENPVGRTLNIDNRMQALVTGVYEDFPHNSDWSETHFFAAWELWVSVNQWMTTQGFTNNFLTIYVQIPPSTDFESVSSKISDAILNNVRDKEDYVAVHPQIFLHPMNKWHLYSDWKNGVNTGGRILFVWLFE
ncbi:MAG: permease prefix domain 2-containing transporter [Bacteroidia bacterium]